MEPRKVNPFIVGDWIKDDKDFIGRESLIRYFLSLQKQFSWLVGSRRMGKTSLLRFLQRRFRERPDTLCIYWDVSGTSDLSDLKDSFVDGLESAAGDFSRLNIHFDADELAGKPLLALLRWLIRLTIKMQFRLILLVDESEALFNLFAQDPSFQIQLTKLFTNASQCHIIMASNHGLQNYDPLNHDHLLSPFLQNFGPAKYLTAWIEEEANTLTGRCTNERDEQTTMFHWTGGLPFLVQMLCFYYNETGSLAAAEERIRQEHTLDLFFRYDMDHLDITSGRMLGFLSHVQSLDEEAARKIHHTEPEWRQRLFILVQLGFVKSDESGRLSISNTFFRQWLQSVYWPEMDADAAEMFEKQKCIMFQVQEKALLVHEEWCEKNVRAREGNACTDPAGLLRAIPPGTAAIPLDEVGEQIPAGLDRAEIKKIGEALYKTVFRKSQAAYREKLTGSRYDFIIHDEIDNKLPLEWLHDGNQFLCQSHGFWRGMNAAPDTLLKNDRPVRVLLIASDTPPLLGYADKELILIRELLQKSALRNNLQLDIYTLFTSQSSIATLDRTCAATPFDIIHYAGHAQLLENAELHLYFYEEQGRKGSVRAVPLKWLTDHLHSQLLLLYLNSCNSGVFPPEKVNKLDQKIKFMMGNRFSTSDELAAKFAADFYKAMLHARFNPVEALLHTRRQWASQATMGKESFFWLLPVLYYFS